MHFMPRGTMLFNIEFFFFFKLQLLLETGFGLGSAT